MSGLPISVSHSQTWRALLVSVALILVSTIALSGCTSDNPEATEAADRAAQAAERAADAAQRAAAAAEEAGQTEPSADDGAGAQAAQAAGRAADAATEAAQAADRAADAAQSASAAASSASQEEPQQAPVDPGELTIYSGRGESLVGSIIERFEAVTGIKVRVRYAGTAELAAAILEEGGRSPADIYYAQDAGALAALAENGALTQLPDDIIGRVSEQFADASGRWVATSGRARVLVYSPERVANPPDSVFDLVNEEMARPRWLGAFQRQLPGLRHCHATDPRRRSNRGMAARHDCQ